VPIRIAPFRLADYLDDDAVIAEFLTAALEDADLRMFLNALNEVAKARGIKESLAADETLSFDAVRKMVSAIGLRLKVWCV
jgi:probable addiction module antidote protein